MDSDTLKQLTTEHLEDMLADLADHMLECTIDAEAIKTELERRGAR